MLHRTALLSAIALGGVLCGGCDDGSPESSSVTPVDEQTEMVLSTPQDVVRSVLVCLRAELRAAERWDHAAANRCRNRLLEAVSTEGIRAACRRRAPNDPRPLDKRVEQIISSWVSIIAYYADGLDLDHMQCPQPAEDANEVVALVPALGKRSSAVIRARCERGQDGLWRVLAVDYKPPAPTTRPASSPRNE